MNPTLTSVLAAATGLSVEERRELVERVLEGLEECPPGGAEDGSPVLSEAWRQEVARRSAEYDSGRAELVSWPEMQARWQALA